MKVQIRQAEPRDIPALARILYQVQAVHAKGRPDLFVDGTRKYTDEELAEILRDADRPILVADVDGEVRGYAFCIYQTYTDDSRVSGRGLYLDDLCVDEDARGQHIGTALYQAVLDMAKNAGCYHVTLNVWCLNRGAMAFYQKCGLVPLKITMEKIL